MNYMPKTVPIQAVQNILGSVEPTWLHASGNKVSGGIGSPIVISTPRGQLTAQGGDWIVQGAADELNVMTDQIFTATYHLSQ